MPDVEALENILSCRGVSPLGDTVGICDTVVETVRIVLPRHANPLGRMHGGRVLEWIIEAAMLAGVRVARGPIVIASMDYMFFLNPVLVGDLFHVRAWVSHVGRSSMEVGVLAYSRRGGRAYVTTYAHLAVVAVDDSLRPRPIPVRVVAGTEWEKRLMEEALQRREQRRPLIERRHTAVADVEPPPALWDEYRVTNYHIVMPEDTVYADTLHAGRLLYWLDETAGILGSAYAGGPVVTAAVDATAFYHPMRPGDVVEIHAAVTYVGRRTVEVTLKTIATGIDGARRHTTTAHFTMAHIGLDGRAREVPQRSPPEDRMIVWREGEERRRRRLAVLEELKKSLRRLEERLSGQ